MPDEPAQTPSVQPTPQPPAVPTDVSGLSTAGPLIQTLAGPQPTPQPTAGRRKEVLSTVPSAEVPTGQSAEVEPSPENSPEMDKFVEKVEQHVVKPPTETVIAQAEPAPVPKTVSQPVVVLPATQKTINQGRGKGTAFSVRWLAEWCLRQIRKFKDILVVYRENP